jgi:hypothetical protein
MTRIVGIGGKLASGKDAVSDHLVEKHGWVKLGMSDALADALYTLNPIVGGVPVYVRIKFLGVPLWKRLAGFRYLRYAKEFDAYGYVKIKENPEVRSLLQKLGTEVGRNMISDSVWTDIMERKVRELASAGVPGVIVTGIRFPNEVTAISEDLGGELWWVSRPSLAEGANAGHASENSVDAADFDRTIVNGGTLEDLYKKVDQIVT